MKTKILFFIPTLGHGGAERVLTNLVNHMDSSKYDITVQTMFDVGIYQNQLAKHIRYIGGLKRYFRGNIHVFKLLSPKRLHKLYIKEHYDVIVAYLEGPSARIVSGCDNSKTRLFAWIHTEHDTLKHAFTSFRGLKEAKRCYEAFDNIIAVSETVRQNFIHFFPSVKSSMVIYNTIEVDKILQGKNEPVEDVVFDPNEINICSVAKLMKTKGYDRLVNILRRLRDNDIPAHVYIIGVGEEQAALKAQIKKLKLEDNWTFVGFRENPYKYVAACDLYVCSSRREGFSTAVTEALIVGTPVVSTNCSGAYELLGYNNEYGVVTENNEDALYRALYEILTRPELLAYYKNQASVRGKQFAPSETVGAVETLIDGGNI